MRLKLFAVTSVIDWDDCDSSVPESSLAATHNVSGGNKVHDAVT
jgi:hypothetical protein